MAGLFRNAGEFGEANAHIAQAKLHIIDDTCLLGRAARMQAEVWYWQGRVEDAISEGQRAIKTFEKLGATGDAEPCRRDLRSVSEG